MSYWAICQKRVMHPSPGDLQRAAQAIGSERGDVPRGNHEPKMKNRVREWTGPSPPFVLLFCCWLPGSPGGLGWVVPPVVFLFVRCEKSFVRGGSGRSTPAFRLPRPEFAQLDVHTCFPRLVFPGFIIEEATSPEESFPIRRVWGVGFLNQSPRAS